MWVPIHVRSTAGWGPKRGVYPVASLAAGGSRDALRHGTNEGQRGSNCRNLRLSIWGSALSDCEDSVTSTVLPPCCH